MQMERAFEARSHFIPEKVEIEQGMAKEKKTSETPAPKKTAAKKAPAKAAVKQVSPKKPAANAAAVAVSAAAPVRKAQPSATELYDEIRRRAYEFYCERGGKHGSHEEDWHRAESEVRSRYEK
jgi:hypothetical protein